MAFSSFYNQDSLQSTIRKCLQARKDTGVGEKYITSL